MKFWKYQGAGNDFIMVDQRENRALDRSHTAIVAGLCDRHFGIGADGLILLEAHPEYDFEMIYFNADGRESSMCGNGGRCIAAFAGHLGIAAGRCRFLAVDGEHEALVDPPAAPYPPEPGSSWVDLKMGDVAEVERHGDVFILDTGSPHYVRFVDSVENVDMIREGRAIRYSERFKTGGINVNLVVVRPDGSLRIRTYERGVEDETLACGTGVTAAALASSVYREKTEGPFAIPVHARGGDLIVRFQSGKQPGSFSEIWLCGPAKQVFEGEISLDRYFLKY